MNADRTPRPALAALSFALALALAGLSACADDEIPEDLGTWPEDQVKLSASPHLAHLVPVLEGGDQLTVQDLYDAEHLEFSGPPDPTALYAALSAEHGALAPLADAEPLRVLTYNVGLLHRWYPFTAVGTPYYVERRDLMPEILLGDGWDVLLLQELWELVDVERFAAAAEARGFKLYAGDRHEQHGLVILVRASLIADEAEDFVEQRFTAQREVERFPGPGVRRGFIAWSFTHAPTGRRIHLYDTHLSSFPQRYQERDIQARTIGGHARAHPDGDIVLVGGDLNAGAYYPEDTFGVDGEEIDDWFLNTLMYPLLLHYGGLVDTHSVLEPAHDVERMNQLLLPFDHGAYLAEPLAGRCADIPVDTFTGTDCNGIYAEQYIATEYPARLDYIMLRDVDRHARVVASDIAYHEPVDIGGGVKAELSDHYAQGATLLIER